MVVIWTLEGRTLEQKTKLAKAITSDVRKILRLKDKESVLVVYNETPRECTFIDGVILEPIVK